MGSSDLELIVYKTPTNAEYSSCFQVIFQFNITYQICLCAYINLKIVIVLIASLNMCIHYAYICSWYTSVYIIINLLYSILLLKKKNNAKYIIREIDTTTVCYVWSNHRHFCLKHFISKYFSLISEYIFFIVYLTNSICLLKLQITWNLSKLGSSLHESHLGICMGTFDQISYVPYRPLLIPTDNFTSYHTIFDLKY